MSHFEIKKPDASGGSLDPGISVLIAEPCIATQYGLRDVLESRWANANVQCITTGKDAIEHMRQRRWDVAVIGDNLPDRSGLEVCSVSRKIAPEMPVLLWGDQLERVQGLRALKTGCAGYVLRSASPEEFLQAITVVLQGRNYISRSLAQVLASSVEIRPVNVDAMHLLLSARELQVMTALAAGASVKEIAGSMNVSPKTVSTYRARILEKLNLRSNAEVIRYCYDHGLLDNDGVPAE